MEEISGDSTAHQLAVLQRSAPAAAKYVHAVEDYAVHSYFKRCVVPLRCSLPRAHTDLIFSRLLRRTHRVGHQLKMFPYRHYGKRYCPLRVRKTAPTYLYLLCAARLL